MTATKEQVNAQLAVVRAIADIIREAKEIPSGHLYAALMDKLNLDQYNAFIDVLKRARLVREERSHLLVWVGPTK